MSTVMESTPKPKTVHTGVEGKKAVADKLGEVLTATYKLVFKTHTYHWNVTGPTFFSLHKLTEEQYEEMFGATDELAERMRALGELAPVKLPAITAAKLSDMPSAAEMVEDLLEEHEALAAQLHDLVELAGEHNDPVTEDLATERSAFHEKAAWMLRATMG